jgi:acyl-CoA synthetase (AMP-forming)/AMP-acid ligase II
MPALDIPTLIAALPEERISFVVTVPAVYSLMLRHPDFAGADVSGVRWVGYGGAPIAPSLVLSLKEASGKATVFNGYGMTETASLMTVLPDSDAVDHADSVGYAVPSVDLGGVSLDDDPSVGELVARGSNVTSGYWNRPDADAKTIVDGWLHNVVRVDAAVLAVPDEVMGEKIGAVLYSDAGEIDVPTVIDHCRSHLADFKVPQYVTVVTEALPRNAGGKLLKAHLREHVHWGDPLR